MNKADLIAAMAVKLEVSRKEADRALEAFISCVEDGLKAGDRVQIVGFGSFEVRQRAERIGRNPQTKEEMTIPASKAPVFKAGKALKDAIANS